MMFVFNGTLEDFVDYLTSESIHLSTLLSIILTLIFGMIMTVAIIGNTCTCIVIVREKSLHTSSNYYIFNLAVCDLIFSCGIPLELYMFWYPAQYPLNNVGCVIHFYLIIALSFISLITLVMFSVQRYVAITKPLLSFVKVDKNRSLKVLAVVWLLSLLLAIPEAQVGKFVKNDISLCVFVVRSSSLKIFMIITTLLLMIIPMVLILIMYFNICMKFNCKTNCEDCNNTSLKQNCKDTKKKINRTIFGVLMTMLVSWVPIVVMRIYVLFPEIFVHNEVMKKNFQYVFYATMGGANLSNALNPFIYSFMSNKFRKAIKLTVQKLRKQRSERSFMARTTHPAVTTASAPSYDCT